MVAVTPEAGLMVSVFVAEEELFLLKTIGKVSPVE
jgi:hypothetical protein